MRSITTLGAALVAAIAVGGTAGASTEAGTVYRASLAGTEVWATSSGKGTFVGKTGGDLPGAWKAVVAHTPLAASARITGGTLSLKAYVNGKLTRVVGDFVGGAIRLTNPSSLRQCKNQIYALRADLGNVRSGLGSVRGGVTSVTLVHYRRELVGQCVIYGATVTGMVTFTTA